MEATLPVTPNDEALMDKYLDFVDRRFSGSGMDAGQMEAYEAANPSFMSVAGIRRYWNKYRQ